jgi:exodeoxyribonuclease V alpha subunit
MSAEFVLPKGLAATSTHFVKLIADLAQSQAPELLLGVLAASEQTLNQNACAFLPALAETPIIPPELIAEPETKTLLYPSLKPWLSALHAHPQIIGNPGDYTPLILEGQRLYLQRYWLYEEKLAQSLKQRSQDTIIVDWNKLQTRFNSLFQPSPDLDWQALAAANVLCNHLTVIAGGPGTGKTTTVSRILALLLELDPDLRVVLAAPTGKAAARMKQALDKNLSALALPTEILAKWPQAALTLHRLLGFQPHSARFKYGPEYPLPWDVVIIDEASMIDLALMSKLVGAIKPDARLVLLGDRDQLASVEAGSVLGDICQAAQNECFTSERMQLLQQIFANTEPLHTAPEKIHNSVLALKVSHRFGPQSGIGQLARAINAGEASQAQTLLNNPQFSDITSRPLPLNLEQALTEIMLPYYANYLASKTPEEALNALEKQIILSALRDGPQGLKNINRAMEQALQISKKLDTRLLWYHLRPVLISENDYLHELYNGDLGLCWNPNGQNPRIWFKQATGHLRSFGPAQLKAHETAWALTVHKSQGSEFEQVWMILPQDPHPLLSRELIYTGITRARQNVEIWSNEKVLTIAIEKKIVRTSGLADKLQSNGL